MNNEISIIQGLLLYILNESKIKKINGYMINQYITFLYLYLLLL